ncbi:hypothetical protein GO993_21500 [Aeromonas salmonicida subsp. salmonicida]|uniref:hypothetical protein n=1 Tax=Aeromonas salmonicida TaxID=645 RepID=UPI00131F9F4F|nr:hypothetical protein [Aeromonas salmonicida]QHE46545.1 hypothetical protein GO994_03720 [Aeromonas salmonicida subsp. salmonicida]QJF57588.1 hypothetical protein GO993_21500 [Aeromonas salmonicida subsp. salmonicida]
MKRFTHDADLRGMVVLRSLGFQLVPFKLHRFRKQRPSNMYVKSMPCQLNLERIFLIFKRTF